MPIVTSTLEHDRADITGNVHFLFAEGATTREQAKAKGYTDLGTFLGMETKGEAAKTEIIKARRGNVRLAGQIPGLIKQGYDLRTTEIADSRKLKFALFGEDVAAYTQPALADQEIDPFPFAAGAPAILNVWYPLQRAGRPVRHLTALTIPDLDEGVDFITDPLVGLIRFTNPASLPAAPVTPSASCPALNSGSPLGLRALKPMTRASWSGYGRLLVFDTRDNREIIMDHEEFSCDITLSSPFNIAYDSLAEMKLLVTITHDVGTFYYRD
jgi:hypothetical protein